MSRIWTSRVIGIVAVSLFVASTAIAADAPEQDETSIKSAPPPPTDSATNGGLDYLLPPPSKNRFQLDAYWDNGLRFESDDQQFKLHVGGNAQIDTTWLIGPQSVFALPGGATNGLGNSEATFLRRVRLRAEGTIFHQFDYTVEYDFANASNENDGIQPPSFNNLTSSPVPCNVWMQIRDVPFFGYVRIGNQVKPIGMVNNTNQRMLPFMERPDNGDGFYAPFDNGCALGISARDWTESERVTWRYGIYQPSTNAFGVSLNKYAVGARVTGLPMYDDDGRQLMHIGLGLWAGELPQDELRARARPALRNGPGFATPVIVDTGTVEGKNQATIAPEFAMVHGSWTLQAEYAGQFFTGASLGGVPQGTVFYHGGYLELLYFLTGEHQNYEKQEGVFGRVIPRNNLYLKNGDDCRTWGAWQVGARFSFLDLTDKNILGGQVYDWTAGVNWFLNPNMKFQFNYILEHRDSQQKAVEGWFNGLGMRAAFDF